MALKVFDLHCDLGHVFEGWFASRDDYDSQCERGLLCCPVCDSKSVSRRVSAPRLNVSGAAREPSAEGTAGAAPAAGEAQAAQLQAEFMRRFREVLRATENVGNRFAVEARRIHEGEAPERPIRGTASLAERQALAEDGIAVMAVPAIFDDDHLQ